VLKFTDDDLSIIIPQTVREGWHFLSYGVLTVDRVKDIGNLEESSLQGACGTQRILQPPSPPQLNIRIYGIRSPSPISRHPGPLNQLHHCLFHPDGR
jgi:hypothetical protein